jgi:hypothetical protein
MFDYKFNYIIITEMKMKNLKKIAITLDFNIQFNAHTDMMI